MLEAVTETNLIMVDKAEYEAMKADAVRYRKLKTFMLPVVKVKVQRTGSPSEWSPEKEYVYVNYTNWRELESVLDETTDNAMGKV